ncbi:MAG: STAS domain-containing protein [Gemmataceae bacterium]
MTRLNDAQSDTIQIIRHGDIVVLVPGAEIENLSEAAVEQAAQIVLGPLREQAPSGMIIDLSQVGFVGSMFLSFLLRCHTIMRKQGSELVLAGVSSRTRELLRVTALDTIWALYDTQAEALDSLGGSD